MHWSCHSAALLPSLSTFLTKTGQADCNTNFGSSTLSNNADPGPVVFSSCMIQCLKHPYNLYTVVTCINYMLLFASGSFQFNAALLYFSLPNPPPPSKNKGKTRCDLPYYNF